MGIVLLVSFGMLSYRFRRKPKLVYSRRVIIVGNLLRAFTTKANQLAAARRGSPAPGGWEQA